MDDKGVIDFLSQWDTMKFRWSIPRISTFSDYSSCGLKNGGSQHGTEGLPKKKWPFDGLRKGFCIPL
jgi:hypothetical protein